MNNKRYYNFMILLYEEKYDANLLANYNAIWIRHDKDLKESGEDDEPHYHIIIKLKNARTINAIAKDFDIRATLVEPIKSMNTSLKYLIHYGYDDKYQYPVEEVSYTDKKLYDKLLKLIENDTPESEKALSLMDFITEYKGNLSYMVFFRYACAINMYDVARRGQTLFLKLIEEHNTFVKRS